MLMDLNIDIKNTCESNLKIEVKPQQIKRNLSKSMLKLAYMSMEGQFKYWGWTHGYQVRGTKVQNVLKVRTCTKFMYNAKYNETKTMLCLE